MENGVSTTKPSDWNYIAEGGAHVIFAYEPDTTTREGEASATDTVEFDWKGKVLRLRKCDLIPEAKQSSKHLVTTRCGTADKIPDEDEYYVKRVVSPKLQPYLDVPKTIEIDASFVAQLRKQAIESGSIPKSRLRDWNACHRYDSGEETTSSNRKITCAILNNYLRMQGETDDIRTKFSISLEIKPKAGYLTSSPLVQPLNRLKYNHSRFEMLQQLHHDGYITKGWNKSTLEQKSGYNPLDLFSQDKKRIEKALWSLFDCPQNNLKVSYCNNALYGINTIPSNGAVYKEALANIFDVRIEKDCQMNLAQKLQKIISFILYNDPFLPKILKLQRLDWIDADGAILIYKQMVKLCNGSQEEAEELLDSVFELRGTSDRPFHDLNAQSPFSDRRSDTILEFLDVVEHFEVLIRKRRDVVSENSTLLNNYHDQCTNLIQKLNVQDCRFLLQNWLLSLAMCDISFFVVISCTNPTNLIQNLVGEEKRNCQVEGCIGDLSFIRGPSHESPGVITSREGLVWNYSIHIVDADQKPAKKLRKKGESETLMKHFRKVDH